MVLSKSSENGHPCLVYKCRTNAFSNFPLNVIHTANNYILFVIKVKDKTHSSSPHLTAIHEKFNSFSFGSDQDGRVGKCCAFSFYNHITVTILQNNYQELPEV